MPKKQLIKKNEPVKMLKAEGQIVSFALGVKTEKFRKKKKKPKQTKIVMK